MDRTRAAPPQVFIRTPSLNRLWRRHDRRDIIIDSSISSSPPCPRPAPPCQSVVTSPVFPPLRPRPSPVKRIPVPESFSSSPDSRFGGMCVRRDSRTVVVEKIGATRPSSFISPSFGAVGKRSGASLTARSRTTLCPATRSSAGSFSPALPPLFHYPERPRSMLRAHLDPRTPYPQLRARSTCQTRSPPCLVKNISTSSRLWCLLVVGFIIPHLSALSVEETSVRALSSYRYGVARIIACRS